MNESFFTLLISIHSALNHIVYCEYIGLPTFEYSNSNGYRQNKIIALQISKLNLFKYFHYFSASSWGGGGGGVVVMYVFGSGLVSVSTPGLKSHSNFDQIIEQRSKEKYCSLTILQQTTFLNDVL